MPPTTTIASGFCVCEPIFVERAAGKRPKMAVMAVIITGRTRLAGSLHDRLAQRQSLGA